jgi:hypothetical protein
VSTILVSAMPSVVAPAALGQRRATVLTVHSTPIATTTVSASVSLTTCTCTQTQPTQTTQVPLAARTTEVSVHRSARAVRVQLKTTVPHAATTARSTSSQGVSGSALVTWAGVDTIANTMSECATRYALAASDQLPGTVWSVSLTRKCLHRTASAPVLMGGRASSVLRRRRSATQAVRLVRSTRLAAHMSVRPATMGTTSPVLVVLGSVSHATTPA